MHSIYRLLTAFFLYSFLSACASLAHQSQLSDFNDGLELLVAGKQKQAREKLNPLCQSKHKASCLFLGKALDVSPDLAVMQGVTTLSSTQLVVAAPEKELLKFYARKKGELKLFLPSLSNEFVFFKRSEKIYHLNFKDLKPSESYELIVFNESGKLLDSRNFRTFEKKIEKPKVAVLSCMRDDYKNLDTIWNSLEKNQADLLFMIGDNSYIDHGLSPLLNGVTPQKIWERQLETRLRLPVFRWKNLVPVYGVWDDHDYGLNNGGAEYKYKTESAKLFRVFFPLDLPEAKIEKGPGISFSLQWQKQNFIFLDNRSFRDAHFHFGKKQRKWISKQLNSQSLNWLVSGDQFFGGYHDFESFQGSHPKAFKQFLKELNRKNHEYLFVSGDRHLSETMKLSAAQYPFLSYEVTSSPVHSSVYEDALERHPNPNRRKGVDGTWNFMTLQWEASGKPETIDVKAKDQNGKLIFEDQLLYP